jgi:hypothetical protein
VEESSECTSIVNSVEEITANFCKALDWKPLFSALYGMYTVMMNELKAFLKVSAQAGQSGIMNKTSKEPTAQGDYFHEVKRCKRHICNDTSQTAKKLTKSVPVTSAVKLPPKAVLARNFFTPLRTNDMDMETTGAKNTLLDQEAPKKSGRPPPIVVTTSTTNLIQL